MHVCVHCFKTVLKLCCTMEKDAAIYTIFISGSCFHELLTVRKTLYIGRSVNGGWALFPHFFFIVLLQVSVLSYSAKFASCYYGPFRYVS